MRHRAQVLPSVPSATSPPITQSVASIPQRQRPGPGPRRTTRQSQKEGLMRGVHRPLRIGAATVGLALVAALLAAPVPARATPQPTASGLAQRPWMNASLPPRVRAELLLARMTLEEKVGQMTQAERGAVTADPSLIT